MRVAAVLAAIFLVFPALLVGCSGEPAPVPVVQFVTPFVPPPTPTPDGPTPTPIPPPEMLLSTVEVYKAGAILASVVGDVVSGKILFLGREHPLTQGSQSMYAFLGVGVLDPPGQHQVRVEFTTRNGSRGSLVEEISVLPTQWTVDSLAFTPEQTSTLLDPKVIADENALLSRMYATFTPKKLWDGAWHTPAPGAITARFGEQRSINGGPPSGNHGGTDIGNETGTPVIATNHGRVIMARELQVRGNFIVIDHGGGLLSGYGHLDGFAVTEGQEVQAGDIIGYVGNTGLSTGAHLHWEMSSFGILLDGLRFVDGSNGF
jgi:hypothetical protein